MTSIKYDTMSSIKSIVLVCALTALYGPATTHASPTNPVQPRQGTGAGILVSGIVPALNKAIDGYSAPACAAQGTPTQYYINGNTSIDGPPPTFFQICYNQGLHLFTPADATAAKCIINLHTTSEDKCISVQGSSCDYTPPTVPPQDLANAANSGGGLAGAIAANLLTTANTGTEKLLKGQMDQWGKGVSSAYVVSAADAVTLRAAVDALVGIRVDMADGGEGSEIDFAVMDGGDFASIKVGLNFWGSNSGNHC